ncbi:hypothetical protein G6F62_014544 [Rhizopus arrhizus]|nr:hypothetical protein G6F62_014544 [Rhizopus arrhizus]
MPSSSARAALTGQVAQHVDALADRQQRQRVGHHAWRAERQRTGEHDRAVLQQLVAQGGNIALTDQAAQGDVEDLVGHGGDLQAGGTWRSPVTQAGRDQRAGARNRQQASGARRARQGRGPSASP